MSGLPLAPIAIGMLIVCMLQLANWRDAMRPPRCPQCRHCQDIIEKEKERQRELQKEWESRHRL